MQLVGECNRCGLCCTMPDGTRCIHLIVDGKLGEPQATRCAVYDKRFDGMLIFGNTPRGGIAHGLCRKDSPQETKIIMQWIGKGCSLTRKP